jgi:hypothetical protein
MPIGMEELYVDNPGSSSAETANVPLEVGQIPDEDIAQSTAGQAADVAPIQVNDMTSQDAVAATGVAGSAEAGQAGAEGYDATTGEITPDMTAAGQMANITSQASPLMTQAANRGSRISNTRGLQNSSIAAGASQAEMVKAATPLAQQDASTYFSNFLEDKKTQNTASSFAANASNTANLTNAQLQTQVELNNAQLESQMAELNAQLETAVSQGNQEEANKIRIAQEELRTQAAITDAELQARINTTNAALDTDVSLANTAEWNDVMGQNAGIASDIARSNADRFAQIEMFNAEQQNDIRQDIMAHNTELNKQYMVGEQQLDLADINGKYAVLLESNRAAATLFDSFMGAIANVMAIPNITADKAAGFIQTLQKGLDNGLNLIDAVTSSTIGGVEGTPGIGENPSPFTPSTPDVTAIDDPNPDLIPQMGTPEWDAMVAGGIIPGGILTGGIGVGF